MSIRLVTSSSHLGEHVVAGQRQVEHRARERPRGGHEALLPGEHLVEPPARDLGERQQAQRLARGRAVHDDHVELARLVVALELQQREDLVHPGRDGQLLGQDPVDAAVGQHAAEPPLHRVSSGARARPPPAPPGPRGSAATGVGSGAQLGLERVRQAVRGIGRHDHGAKPAARDLRGRSPRPRSSCRLPPCRCRGSCGVSSVARFYAHARVVAGSRDAGGRWLAVAGTLTRCRPSGCLARTWACAPPPTAQPDRGARRGARLRLAVDGRARRRAEPAASRPRRWSPTTRSSTRSSRSASWRA